MDNQGSENGGNETPPTPEEIAEWREKAAQVDELKAKNEELATSLSTHEEQLAKLTNKEFNFKKFRAAEEEKRREMMEGFSAKERALINEIDAMRARQDESESRYFGQVREAVLKQLAGDNEEMRGKLQDAVKESVAYLGEPKTAEDVAARYERAYALLTGTPKTVNPLNRFTPTTGVIKESNETGFTNTPSGKALFESKFARQIAKAKAVNPNINI